MRFCFYTKFQYCSVIPIGFNMETKFQTLSPTPQPGRTAPKSYLDYEKQYFCDWYS